MLIKLLLILFGVIVICISNLKLIENSKVVCGKFHVPYSIIGLFISGTIIIVSEAFSFYLILNETNYDLVLQFINNLSLFEFLLTLIGLLGTFSVSIHSQLVLKEVIYFPVLVFIYFFALFDETIYFIESLLMLFVFISSSFFLYKYNSLVGKDTIGVEIGLYLSRKNESISFSFFKFIFFTLTLLLGCNMIFHNFFKVFSFESLHMLLYSIIISIPGIFTVFYLSRRGEVDVAFASLFLSIIIKLYILVGGTGLFDRISIHVSTFYQICAFFILSVILCLFLLKKYYKNIY